MTEIIMDGEPLEVGDEVYCLLRGEGKVSSTCFVEPYPIRVDFENGTVESYTSDFKRITKNKTRTLYWQKPEIIPPPKPKKKIKVWDWFVEWPNGDTNKMCGETEQYARNGVKIAQKIDGTEREVER